MVAIFVVFPQHGVLLLLRAKTRLLHLHYFLCYVLMCSLFNSGQILSSLVDSQKLSQYMLNLHNIVC